MTINDAHRLRAALDARIVNQSGSEDPYPLRRRLAYQRILRRLAEDANGGWVLKGGYLLEARLDTRARATKDLDLAMRSLAGGSDVATLLRTALRADPDGDLFTFAVAPPAALVTDANQHRAWRVTVDALLDDRSFAKLRIDLVERLGEVEGATESLTIPVPITGLSFTDARVTAVDVAQHAAEKFHALCLVFPDGRQNTRVKDLLDIVLMFEAGLLPTPNLQVRIETVFRLRNNTMPPSALPAPPASWRRDYQSLAASTQAQTADIDSAFALAQSLFTINQPTA